jgi:hypothetical protein
LSKLRSAARNPGQTLTTNGRHQNLFVVFQPGSARCMMKL